MFFSLAKLDQGEDFRWRFIAVPFSLIYTNIYHHSFCYRGYTVKVRGALKVINNYRCRGSLLTPEGMVSTFVECVIVVKITKSFLSGRC